MPTGFGKTAAVLAAWLWKIARNDPQTPRRLVYCLPMRTLVEQTEDAARKWIDAAHMSLELEDVQLDILMGGCGKERRGLPKWMLNPALPGILIGTQDLLVSAALMRGYGISRYRWPVDFALLQNDALWIFDEVQLTGATLATSAQMEGFRREFKTGSNCHTLWMSATLDPSWLKTADFSPMDSYRPHDLSAADLARAEHLWTASKRLHVLDLASQGVGKKDGLKSYATAVAKAACKQARSGTCTIVFLNTVARAQAVYAALGNDSQERLLVHSRFRKADRDRLMKRLRDPVPAEGRIVIATQALEAGVDVTSAILITEIAPWSSLVQRFGRCNRYGECGTEGADVFWINLPDEDARPYESGDFAEARKNLATLSACGPADLAAIHPSAPPRGHVIRKRDFLDLFDTDPDLSGFDVDISLYVRDADDTDVRLFWRPVEGATPPEKAPAPSRDELCPAPIGGAKALIKRKGVKAWRWDALASVWYVVKEGDVFPGMVIWVDTASGGYDPKTGFVAGATGVVEVVPARGVEETSLDADPDAHTSTVRVSLARHGAHAHDQATRLAEALGLSESERGLIVEAARWHDLGKAHPAFVERTAAALTNGVQPPLAKWPSTKDEKPQKHSRKYFRHELASALGYLVNHGYGNDASLPAYLIAAHHGKVRMRLRALPKEPPPKDGRLFARGVWDGDLLPETCLGDFVVPETRLDLDLMQLGEGPCGPSWSARTQALLKQYGPFRLAWLEALVRIADWRASEAEEDAGHDDL
ncbi:MAG: CRISPR-associated helicase Cas3' [Alphaproteobacteria bacterium]|nr:CRISPR-associated helicase Cas3' [Alphaproteobacteria bacterium]